MNTTQPQQTGEGNAPRVKWIAVRTFDKHNGWQTLEKFDNFRDAHDRVEEIRASNSLWTVNNLKLEQA